jgi:hypothetical protein
MATAAASPLASPSLSLGSTSESPPKRLANISGLTQLQQLGYSAACGLHGVFAAGVVKQVCTTFSQLRSLVLYGTVHQAGIDVLLAHATHLHHLTVGALYITQDRSASPCSWQELVADKYHGGLLMLRQLPLHSLTRLRFAGWELPSPCPRLSIVAKGSSSCSVSAHRVLVNLATCPAWINSGLHVRASMKGFNNDNFRPTCSQVLAAICTSVLKQVHHVRIKGLECVFNASNLAALGQVVGSSLKLVGCPLSSDFWPAVGALLPALQTLSINEALLAL